MPSFEQLLNAKLGPAQTAVTQWSEMISKLNALKTEAAAMKTKADQSTWRGENASVTKEFVTKTAKEFGDAVTEAESVRDLLQDAHTLLKSAQDDLKLTYENPPPGITIYPNGVISHRVHPDRRSAGSTEPVATEAQFEALRGKIEGILKRAAEADELCAWGLRALIKNHPNDFGSTDLGGIADAKKLREEERQQAENGREAAKLYARWEHLDDKERERLLKLVEEGQGSPAFSAELMTNLSFHGREQQEAVLLLAGSLEHGGRDGRLSATDARLYRALSGSLATATGPDSPLGSPGGVTSAWTDRLIAVARDGNGLPNQHPGQLGGGAAGLSALTKLMAADNDGPPVYDPNKDPGEKSSPWRKDEGDPVYSEAFLTEVADTIRDWETHTDDPYGDYMKGWKGTQEDPMRGLLNAMSLNPSASTHYFDPNTTDNLKYFLDDRKWPGGSVESKMPEELQYSSARAELGLALEAAATGRVPGSPMHPVPSHHDGAEVAIFERVMGEYTKELRTDQSAVPVSMRLPMADMIADYGADVHQILGKKMDGPTDFNQLEIDRGDLTRIIRSMAEDPNAFKAVHGSQTAVIGEGLARFPEDSFRREDPELRAWVKQSASVLGHLDGVRGDVIYDLGQAEKDANNWNKMVNYHVYGGILTPVPILGDGVQRAIDWGLSGNLNNENAKVDAATRENMIKHYDEGQRQMYGMLRGMATHRGLTEAELDASPGEFEDHLQTITEQWYQNGMEDADKSMGQ
ncbi:DUF6571 family protein [Streptomyces termitum]|uniref:Uncharacterized protein n=1 Tax=Streptomyces termitum TaxID=67368 RepID=A0A918WB25_9ACTN|nr:DUF6571 family protein [Streptomyces termitum]GHA88190.1 hypothetical protein GCM10010305_34760 [Streptomyces termitum]